MDFYLIKTCVAVTILCNMRQSLKGRDLSSHALASSFFFAFVLIAEGNVVLKAVINFQARVSDKNFSADAQTESYCEKKLKKLF